MWRFSVFSLEMEKQCDAKYGTKYAATPETAQKDLEELEDRLHRQQSHLRYLERLGHVVAVEPREKLPRQMPGPLPIPSSDFGLVTGRPTGSSSSGGTGALRPPLPVKIRLNNGKPRKPAVKKRKNDNTESKLNASSPAASSIFGETSGPSP